ncbi:MAG TPA: YegS/Rv2252/BmrU family lipid kinase [Candidatus Dormibacteraeota bacterium]
MSWRRPKVRTLDEFLLRRLPRPRRSRLDYSIAFISRGADGALLWLGTAGVMAALSPRAGRRAAGRGLLALAVASALVNGPLKLLSRRRRPAATVPRRATPWVRRPVTYSFPSGHTASACAFVTGASLELPRLTLPLGGLACAVAYSRLHTRVHYPTDVLAGAALGVATAVATRRLADARSEGGQGLLRSAPRDAPRLQFSEAVLVISPHAGRAATGLGRARRALEAEGITVLKELPVQEVESLRELLAERATAPPLVIAAGGDGTVGAVADVLAGSRAVLGVIPLGTSNDFARSLDLPTRIDKAVALFREGKVSTIDLGRIEAPGERPRHFVHAATAGLNVSFAKIATQASFRKRLGRLAYVVAAVLAVEERRPFHCRLVIDGRVHDLELLHLSIINAPVFGGFLGMRLRESSVDDRLLDVLAVENIPLRRAVRAALEAVLQVRRTMSGIHSFHVSRMDVHSDRPLEAALDGEVCGRLPATFAVAGEALNIVTPVEFRDVDDV